MRSGLGEGAEQIAVLGHSFQHVRGCEHHYRRLIGLGNRRGRRGAAAPGPGAVGPGAAPCSAHAITSSQRSGVETVGIGFARSEYGATVVFAGLFWLQSMKTLPGGPSSPSRW